MRIPVLRIVGRVGIGDHRGDPQRRGDRGLGVGGEDRRGIYQGRSAPPEEGRHWGMAVWIGAKTRAAGQPIEGESCRAA